MKQNKNNVLVKRYIVSPLAFAAILMAIVSVTMWAHSPTDAAPKSNSAAGTTVESRFSFTGLSGWWQGATNKVSMALFQDSQSCFTSAQYNTGTIDATSARGQYQASLTSAGYTVTPGAVQTLTLQTGAGKQQYQLQQYSVSSIGNAATPEGGQEVGYLQLNGGYVKLIGDCDTAAELPATIPALQSIKFDTAG